MITLSPLTIVEENDVLVNKAEVFFANVLDICFTHAQNEVDFLVWKVAEDEDLKPYVAKKLSKYVWCTPLVHSVFTSPVLERSWVEAVLSTALEAYSLNAKTVMLLVGRPDCDAVLFAYAVNTFVCGAVSEGAKLLWWVKEQGQLSLDRLVELYRLGDHEAFEEAVWNVFDDSIPWGHKSIEEYVLENIYSHYPDLPDSWVKHMLKSLRHS